MHALNGGRGRMSASNAATAFTFRVEATFTFSAAAGFQK